MILAAPLVIPFAKAVGLSVGALGMAALADQVNEYIQANPEESMKILSTIVPGVGIGQIFMSKEDKISLEDLDEMTDEEAQDLSKEEKAELMKQAGKKRNRELSIATSEKIGLSGPGKEKQDIEYEIDERYDEGGVEQKKAPFDYTKFFRKRRADGGAIGIEVLFEEKKPRKNFQEGGYEPLFTEDVETFTAPIGLNTTTVPSRISKAYTDATNEAFKIGNVAASTGLTNPESIMKVSEMPMAVRTLSDINMMDRKNISNPYSKFEKQGLSSDYRHTLGTSAFKDSIIDYLGSNLGIDKQSGILDTIGSLVAKGATVFEEGKDALSQLKSYQNIDPYSGIQDYGAIPSGLKLSEILAQPIEDYEANFFAADQIPFGTSPLKKMEMIQAYRKFGMDNYMQQLENQKKAAMQEQIRKAEAAAKAEAARAAKYGATNYGQGAGGQSYSNMGTQGFGVAAGGMGGPVSNRTGRGRTDYGKGGRVGFNLGGLLTGQAKNIYDTMSAAGYFTEDEIRNAITGAGYEIPGTTTPNTPTTIQPVGLQIGNDNFSPFNPDPNKIQSVRQDPKIQANLEAIQRSQALEGMGIQDPFASEGQPGKEYYGDMMEIDLSPGKQSMFAKAKQRLSGAFGKVKGLMDNPVMNAMSFAVNPLIGGVKGIASFANKMLPTSTRGFVENAAGNLGIFVDDIGRIVNTGDYMDPNNIMAGYNLNMINANTFQKRIDRIRRGRLSDQKKQERINIIREAQRKIEAAQKLARLQAEQANLAKGRAPSGGQFDDGPGGAYTGPGGLGGGQFKDSMGNVDYQDPYDPGGGEKDGGIIGYKKGGLASMFVEKR